MDVKIILYTEYFLLSLSIIYFIFKIHKTNIIIGTFDEPIKEYISIWNASNEASHAFEPSMKNNEMYFSKGYHFAYNRLNIDYLTIVLAHLKYQKEKKGVGLGVSELVFKLVPVFVLLVTTVTTSVWNIYNLSEKFASQIEDTTQKVTNYNSIAEAVKQFSMSNVNLLGVLLLLFIIVYVMTLGDIFSNEKRTSEAQKRISIIEEIIKHRKVESNSLYAQGQHLTTEKDFNDAFLLCIPIEVIFNNQIFNKGFIEVHEANDVTINKIKYKKSEFIFKT
ncbi:hypothetical protein [Paenibacillus donghaensis]|uniref:Uncharacterized protein n=1 Tax=Paenibacillus donghaensis TaxID=414771 RepID=A0A2Z2KC76_9BACL|nr:hypothetical protein [Paenibacillus donghaensis]ASA23434.1 hypothetical protein B9T62_23075 [Paenibacillus donghaensis]